MPDKYIVEGVLPRLIRYRYPFFGRYAVEKFRKARPVMDGPLPPRAGVYAALPMHVMLAKYLTSGAKVVYALLCYHANGKPWARPSIEAIAQRTGLATTAVGRAIDRLVKYEYITRVGHSGPYLQEMQNLIYAYYKNDKKGYAEEMACLSERPRGPREQRVNYYILRWNRYWDLAWSWQEPKPRFRSTTGTPAEMMETLVRGDDVHHAKKKRKRVYKKKAPWPSRKGMKRQRAAPQHAAVTIVSLLGKGPQGQRAAVQGPSATREELDVIALFQRWRKEQTGSDREVPIDDNLPAVRDLLARMKQRKAMPAELEALIGFYVMDKARPLRERHWKVLDDRLRIPEDEVEAANITLREACSEKTQQRFFDAVRSFTVAVIKTFTRNKSLDYYPALEELRGTFMGAGMGSLDAAKELNRQLAQGKKEK